MINVDFHEGKSIKWWHEQFRRDKIDMQPPYQRRSFIWSAWKQAHLVDSVLNGFDVPKFYLANFLSMPSKVLNRARRPYAIIDGKQRLQALFDFLDDKVALNSTIELYEYPDANVGGYLFSDLVAKYPILADRVQSFVPTMMNVVTDNEHLIEELFVRLNSGEATTGAERRNAMGGPVPFIVRDLVLHPFFQHKIRFNIARMQDFNLAAKLLLMEFRGGFVDTKARNLDDFAKTAAKSTNFNQSVDLGDYASARDRVFNTLELITPTFDDRDNLLAAQGHIPVYYWLMRQNSELRPWVRLFLQEFTKLVSDNLKMLRIDPDSADQRLANYYTLGRTTNDEASLRGRYEILLRGLRGFANRHPNLV